MPIDTSITEVTTGEAEFPVPWGHDGEYSIYINGTTEYFYSSFKVVKKLNQMSSFEFMLEGVNRTDDTNVREGNTILFFLDTTLYFKGRIDKVQFQSDEYCTIKGYGMEVKLVDKQIASRTTYTNTASNTILQKVISQNDDGASPWILTEGTIENYGNISVRSEFDNKLQFAASVAQSCNNSSGLSYDWWVSQSDADKYDTNYFNKYDTNYFNCTSYRGSATSVYTFYASGDDMNCTFTQNEQDIQSLWNHVRVLGYGDGTNQISTSFYNATGDGTDPEYTVTTSAIDLDDTSLTIADGTKLSASGTCILAEEQCTYTRSGNTLTLTRAQNSTTATVHPKGIYIADYIAPTEAAAETGSSIKTYGLKKNTVTDVSIIDGDTLSTSKGTIQSVASKLLLEHLEPYTRITLNPMDPRYVLNNIMLGDKVTVVDSDTGLNGDFRIVGYELSYDDSGENLVIEVSNRKLYLIEQIQEIKKASTDLSAYMQGATNCYMTGETDNCDSSHPLRIDFYMPDEAIAVNKVKLMYRLSKHRIDSVITAAGSAHYHPLNISASGAHTHSLTGISATNESLHYHTATISDYGGSPVAVGIIPGTSGNLRFMSTQGNTSSQTINASASTHTHTITGGTAASEGHTHTGIATNNENIHTHALSYGIYDSGTYNNTDIAVSVDGTDRTAAIETLKGSALVYIENATENSTLTNDYMQLSSYLSTPITGGWHYIIVTPNGNCRIAADLYIQCFLHSL